MIEKEMLQSPASCRVDTRDLDVARHAVGKIFCPHFLTTEKASRESFHARHHMRQGNGYSTSLVSYGATVDIDPGELSRFYLLQIPIKGAAKVRCGAAEVDSQAARSASLLSPTLATRMRWEEGCEQVIVLMDREPVEHVFETLTHEAGGPVEFDPLIDLSNARGQGLVQHINLMLMATQHGAEQATGFPPAYTAMLRDGLISLLLAGFRHSRTASMMRPQNDCGPMAVRKADDFMRAHAATPIATGDIAVAAGVPLRTLQESYRKARGMTLTEALHDIRLEKLRSLLLSGEADLSVADAVFSVGLGHLGRAAAAYRTRYGESPLQTLRRTKA